MTQFSTRLGVGIVSSDGMRDAVARIADAAAHAFYLSSRGDPFASVVLEPAARGAPGRVSGTKTDDRVS